MELTRSEDIPFSLSEITADWLTRALREQGLINPSTSVASFTSQTIGAEAGFNGDVAILTLDYQGADENPEAPASLVVKIPIASKNRIMGQTMGLYEKEIRFYRDLQPILSVRAPRHYYSALDAADDPDVVMERLQGLNSLPVGVVRVLTKALSWFVRMTPRRYVLLIEDLSSYRLGDQMDNYSAEELRRILAAMARLHAQFWDSEELKSRTWIQPMAATSRIIQGMFLDSIKKFRAEVGDDLSDRQQQLVGWLCEHGAELTERLGEEPPTLLHGDFRLDNICFDDGKDEILLFDWQTMQNGAAGMDLAYFLSAALPDDASHHEIDETIAAYHDALLDQGVDISAARLRWQYDVGMLAMLHRILPAMFQGSLELGEGRGRDMIQAWVNKTFRRVEPIQFESILAAAPA